MVVAAASSIVAPHSESVNVDLATRFASSAASSSLGLHFESVTLDPFEAMGVPAFVAVPSSFVLHFENANGDQSEHFHFACVLVLVLLKQLV